MGSQRTNGKGALEGSVVRRGSEVACAKRKRRRRGGRRKRKGEFGSRA